jgi:hypothetical protein
MEILKTIPVDNLGQILVLSRNYIEGDYSVLSKVPFSYRPVFSASVEYLRQKCGKHYSDYSKEVEEENWALEYKECVLSKLKEMDSEHYRRNHKERLNDIN